MRTPRYLPGVRNGVIAKRQGRAKNPSTSKGFRAGSVGEGMSSQRRNSRRFSIHSGGVARSAHSTRSAHSRGWRRSEGRGAKVMWLMILTGVALAAGFVFALRSQINAYRIAQAEEQLKSKLDEYTRQQKFLALDGQRAMNADESDRAGRWNGLEHLKLDKETAQRDVSVQKVVSTSPVKAPQADQNDRVSVRRPVRAVSQPKAAKLVKSVKTGKTPKAPPVIKLNAANNAKANRKRQ
jgi:hypothetical protein